MFIRNNKRINIDAPHEIDGVRYPNLRDPVLRASLGVTEVPDPVRPDDRFYFIVENPDGTLNVTPKPLDGLKETALAQVKEIRRNSLDSFTKSAGVKAVYDENLIAARAHADNTADVVVIRTGETAATYLQRMGLGMGITAAQFAGYVLTENAVAAVKAGEIEAEYVRVAYSVIPACDFDTIQGVVAAYSAFCEARVAP